MSSGPPPLPSSVRFTYAPCAPTLANWYGQPDYEGCLLTWDPVPDVVGLIGVRSEKPLPENCALDLMSGRYQQVAEQVVVRRPAAALVDDQTHERPFYLVLARTAAGEFVAVKNLKAEPLTREGLKAQRAQAAFWSNPMGRPKGRDPTRLDYLPLRPSGFSGFEWTYPEDVPDLVGYHLIVSPQPIGALEGDPMEVAQFKEVIYGKRATLIKLEPFVTRLVDNVSPEGEYAYFALLACDANGGRVQIPLHHTTTPFSDDLPLRYAQPQGGVLGRHPEQMQEAFAAWRQRMAPAAAALNAPPQAPAAAAPQGPPWSSIKPARPPHLAAYQADPTYWGMQLRWDAPAGDARTRFVALRADRFPPDQAVGPLLVGAMQPPPFCHRIEFAGPATSLLDVECHQHVWYCVAIVEGGQPRPVANLTERPLTRPPSGDAEAVYWHCAGEPLRDRLPPVAEVEATQRPDAAPLALSWGTSDLIDAPQALEVIHLRRPPHWPQDQAAWAALLRGEPSPLGERFEVPPTLDGVRDDLLPVGSPAWVAVVARDERGNRFGVPVFVSALEAAGAGARGWPLLSDPYAKPAPPAPLERGFVALPVGASLPAASLDDDVGLSTLDELSSLGASDAPESVDSLADRPLPTVTAELMSAEPAPSADATPPSPVTGVTEPAPEPAPGPEPAPSDVTWQALPQAWHMTRLPLPPRDASARWRLLRAERPQPLRWAEVQALVSEAERGQASGAVRAFALPERARVVVDNLTPDGGDAAWALVYEGRDGAWSQAPLPAPLSPPWPADLRERALYLLDADDAAIDSRVAAQLRAARADASRASECLARAHTIWPEHTRALAFAHARRAP